MKTALPWVLWALSVVLASAALLGLTHKALALDESRLHMELERRHGEQLRTALWRMESVALPLLMRESLAFLEPPGDFVLLHVAIDAAGILSSPEAPMKGPPSPTRFMLEDLRRRPEFLRALWALPQAVRDEPANADVALQQMNQVREGLDDLGNNAQKNDYDMRSMSSKMYTNQSKNKQQILETGPPKLVPMVPLWAGDQLVLARRNGKRIEASVIDFKSLAAHLEGMLSDLYPQARVSRSGSSPDPNLSLASLPLTLDSGPAATADPIEPAIQGGLQQSLWLAWSGLGVAGMASGLLLLASQRLSTKRRDFVTAVTHELRTPLTSLRLHTDLMADTRTPLENRSRHFAAIRDSADRLAHLVENVLSYSRLERGRRTTRTQMTIHDLLASPVKAIGERMNQAGFSFSCKIPPQISGIRLETDAGAVARILFNLADNSLKYAASGAVFRIDVSVEDNHVLLCASDAGPGLPKASRVFHPFRKSAQQAALSAPGVGLGLPMSFRLARELGGFLEQDSDHTPGTCWVLGLPVMRQS